ncbi:hypothetical protein P3G55_18675 [Leptospira sp. 96542]|nr:hypothetical protein [Leptospira sp. 96542]
MKEDHQPLKRRIALVLGAATVIFYLFLYLYALPLLVSSRNDTHVLVGLVSLVLSVLVLFFLWVFRKQIWS